MRRLLLIALLGDLGGCSDDTATPGGACSAGDPCGGDLVCDFTAPDGAVCVEPDADDDGDGLPAKLDFCQHQMGGQYDEDRDGIGDDCDKCPIAAPPATPDSDNDDVDAPCDPDPSTPGDRIAVFDGFNGGAVPSGWKSVGAVTVQGGVAKLTPGGATAQLTAPLPLVTTHTAILAGWRVDATDTTATENAAAVVGIDQRPAGVTVISCGASHVGTMDRLVLDTDVTTAQDTVDQLFDTASLYRALLDLEAAQAQCALIGDHDAGAAQAMTNGEAMSEAGVSAKAATIEFAYLLVVQRAPGGPGTP